MRQIIFSYITDGQSKYAITIWRDDCEREYKNPTTASRHRIVDLMQKVGIEQKLKVGELTLFYSNKIA
jgi:hypothetical protein